MSLPVFDSASSSGGGNVASITWSHTVGAGDNPFLEIYIHEAYGADNVSGVTFNGVSATRKSASLTNTGCYRYYLANPATGTHDIVVTFTTTKDRGKAVGAVSYLHVNQTNPYLSLVTANLGTAGTAFSANLSTVNLNTLIVDCEAWRPGSSTLATVTADAGQTARVNKGQTHTSDTATLLVTEKSAATIGTYAMGGDASINCQVDDIIVALCGDGLADGVISYYKLDESSGNAADSVGGNTLTNTDVTYGNTSPKINNYASFNGSSAFLDGGDIATVDGIGVLAVGGWIYPTANNTRGMIISKDLSGQRSWFLSKSESGADNYLTFQIGDGNPTSGGLVVSTTQLTINAWNFVVAIYNKNGSASTDRLKIYLNANLVSGTPAVDRTTDLPATTAKLQLGAREYVGSRQFFTGKLDEFFIYNREPTSTEITSLYNSGAGWQYPFPTSVAYTVTVTESLNTSEAKSRAWNSTVTKSEVFSLSNVISKSWVATFSKVETFSFSDLVTKTQAFVKTVSDTIGLTDVIDVVKQSLNSVTITEIMNLTEVKSVVSFFGVVKTELISLADQIVSVSLKIVTITEQFVLTEVKSISTFFSGIITESLTITDTLTTALFKYLTIVENIVITDTTTILKSFGVIISESLRLAEIKTITMRGWNFATKHVASWTNKTKNNTSWTNKVKNLSNWNFKNKS